MFLIQWSESHNGTSAMWAWGDPFPWEDQGSLLMAASPWTRQELMLAKLARGAACQGIPVEETDPAGPAKQDWVFLWVMCHRGDTLGAQGLGAREGPGREELVEVSTSSVLGLRTLLSLYPDTHCMKWRCCRITECDSQERTLEMLYGTTSVILSSTRTGPLGRKSCSFAGRSWWFYAHCSTGEY